MATRTAFVSDNLPSPSAGQWKIEVTALCPQCGHEMSFVAVAPTVTEFMCLACPHKEKRVGISNDQVINAVLKQAAAKS
jgi:hypothetical protein